MFLLTAHLQMLAQYSLHLGVDVRFCSWSHDFLLSAMDGDGSPRHLTAQNFYSAIALQTH